jgi:succinoglycan biosynthesis transport protein ExoP
MECAARPESRPTQRIETMSSVIANPIFRNILRGILVWAPLWIGTTALFGTLGILYILFFKQDQFLASQAILVRDEANGAVMRLGRFQTQAEMKAAQETILEMAKSHQVVREALSATGPEPERFSFSFGPAEAFPSTRQIEDFAKDAIAVHAPKGTEFGVTEVIYIDIKSNSQQRALDLNRALCDALESRLQQVRTARADSVIAELSYARDAAKAELKVATDQLHVMEREAGTDLSDLRGMTDMIAGGSSARLEYDQIKNELRQTEQTLQQLQSDRELLHKAIEDPASFVIAPSALLNSQPGLKRFREGLVDAQLSASQLSGKFTEEHPLVIASNSAQNTIVQRFSRELRASIESIEADLAVVEKKRERLESQRILLEGRLSQIADGRARYANLATDVKSRNAILENAERELAEATAARDSSRSTSLLTRLDAPIVSDKPVGPGKTMLAAVCTAAGLAFGLGIVFLITPIDAGPTFGRRISDRFHGRRQSDTATTETPNPTSAAPPATPTPSLDIAAVEKTFKDSGSRISSTRAGDPREWKTEPFDPRVTPRPRSRNADSDNG